MYDYNDDGAAERRLSTQDIAQIKKWKALIKQKSVLHMSLKIDLGKPFNFGRYVLPHALVPEEVNKQFKLFDQILASYNEQKAIRQYLLCLHEDLFKMNCMDILSYHDVPWTDLGMGEMTATDRASTSFAHLMSKVKEHRPEPPYLSTLKEPAAFKSMFSKKSRRSIELQKLQQSSSWIGQNFVDQTYFTHKDRVRLSLSRSLGKCPRELNNHMRQEVVAHFNPKEELFIILVLMRTSISHSISTLIGVPQAYQPQNGCCAIKVLRHMLQPYTARNTPMTLLNIYKIKRKWLAHIPSTIAKQKVYLWEQCGYSPYWLDLFLNRFKQAGRTFIYSYVSCFGNQSKGGPKILMVRYVCMLGVAMVGQNNYLRVVAAFGLHRAGMSIEKISMLFDVASQLKYQYKGHCFKPLSYVDFERQDQVLISTLILVISYMIDNYYVDRQAQQHLQRKHSPQEILDICMAITVAESFDLFTFYYMPTTWEDILQKFKENEAATVFSKEGVLTPQKPATKKLLYHLQDIRKKRAIFRCF